MSERKIPAEIYSRCCGYFRPENQYNPGKREEFKERQYLTLPSKEILNKKKRQRASERNFNV